MATARKKQITALETQYPKVMEMFADPQITNYWKQPDCFNGFVHFRKFRVTIELIEEPTEVLHERLQKLWRESDNHHEWMPLKAAAAKVGLDLKAEDYGKFRRK